MTYSLRRSAAALAATAAAAAIAIVAAPSAGAAPYSHQATDSVSTQNPAVGGSLTLSGSGFGPNETVTNTLHTVTITLPSAHTDASGSFSIVVTLPANVSGRHTIVSAGVSSHRTATVQLTIGSTNHANGALGAGSGGSLSATGVAVFGIAALGVALMAGGGISLLAGRRRRVRV